MGVLLRSLGGEVSPGVGIREPGVQVHGYGCVLLSYQVPYPFAWVCRGRIGRYGVHATDEVGAVVDIGQG